MVVSRDSWILVSGLPVVWWTMGPWCCVVGSGWGREVGGWYLVRDGWWEIVGGCW